MNIKFALLTIFCFFLLFSCAERKVYLSDGRDKGEILKKEDKIQTEETKPADKDKKDKYDEFISSEFREIIKKLHEEISDIYFDYDKYDIKQNDIPTLKKVASALLKYPNLRVIIEGHCDERGTNEYNFALGQKRANAAKQYLITLGVPSSKIDIISYGEEKPLCSEQNEACWQKNRRAHFVFIEEGK